MNTPRLSRFAAMTAVSPLAKLAGALAPVFIASAVIAASPLPKPDQKADPQMKAVLEQLAALKPKPFQTLTAAEARKQPTATDAVKALLKKQNGGMLPPPEPVAKVENKTVPGPYGAIPVRVYTPEGTGPFPVLVYFHGGGWVIASIETYDSSCRALANGAKCVVVSVGYHQAPEYRFPAQHEDSYAATQYIMKNAADFGGDPKRVAVGGESAGGNLAAGVCIMARERKGMMPIHQLNVYPIASYNTNTVSYNQNADAIPLSKPAMGWFFKNTLRSPVDGKNPLISLVSANLKGLPPATVITAEIDPLRTDGISFTSQLKKAGVPVSYQYYSGVTHEFFGMGAVVDKAKLANKFAADELRKAFKN